MESGVIINQTPSKKKNIKPDRISISQKSAQLISTWILQLKEKQPGLKIKPADIVNSIIESHSPQLSSKEAKEIIQQNFDEVDFFKWAIKEVQKSQAGDAKITLQDLMKRRGSSTPRGIKKKQQKSRQVHESNEEASSSLPVNNQKS